MSRSLQRTLVKLILATALPVISSSSLGRQLMAYAGSCSPATWYNPSSVTYNTISSANTLSTSSDDEDA